MTVSNGEDNDMVPRIVFRDKRDVDTLATLVDQYSSYLMAQGDSLSALVEVASEEGMTVVGDKEAQTTITEQMQYLAGLLRVLSSEAARLDTQAREARDTAYREELRKAGLNSEQG